MRLYVLDTGLIESSDMSMWSPNAATGSYGELSVRSYLIVHPRGTILWDTGIDDQGIARTQGRRIILSKCHRRRVCAPQSGTRRWSSRSRAASTS
jgi:hypothetical protein